MGGRRAASLSDVLASARRYPRLERELDEGLKRNDPETASKAAATLALKVIPSDDLASYLRLLVPFVKKQLDAPKKSPDLRSDVRHEWSRLKKTHGIRASEAVNSSVVQAVIDLLRTRS